MYTRHIHIYIQNKIIHRTLPCNGWLNNIKIKNNNICSYCNNNDTITHFLIDCTSNKIFWKIWARWWISITDFNIGEENNIHKTILFGFPGNSSNAIVKLLHFILQIFHLYRKETSLMSEPLSLTEIWMPRPSL